jgi:hypothetical protein
MTKEMDCDLNVPGFVLTNRENCIRITNTIDHYGGEFRAKTLTKQVAWIGYDRDGNKGNHF